jgi:hypothetical protein
MPTFPWKRWNFNAAIRRLAIWVDGARPDASPTFTAGSAVPTAHEPKGSVYLRTSGSGASQVIYVATDSVGTWVALSTVGLATQVVVAAGQAYVMDLLLAATGEAIVKLADNLASAFEIVEGANSYLKIVTTNSLEQIVFGKPIAFAATAQLIADVGTGVAIPVNRGNISMSITQNGAETNTLAIPTFIGQRLTLVVDVDTSGARVITVAAAINQAGNTIITMTEVNDFIELVGVKCAGGNLRWRVAANDGCALS